MCEKVQRLYGSMITNKLSKDGLLILLFHGVIKQNNYGVRNYIRKHIEQDYFFQILEKLKDSGTCLSMDEVIKCHDLKTTLLILLRSLLMMALKIMLPLQRPY